MVASFVMNDGPALNASAIFSASVDGIVFMATCCLLVCAEAPEKSLAQEQSVLSSGQSRKVELTYV